MHTQRKIRKGQLVILPMAMHAKGAPKSIHPSWQRQTAAV
jgi:hypothetical protein